MTEKHEKLLADFELRMRQLIFLCDSLKIENASLRADVDQKDDIIASLNLDLEQLKTKYDNLRFAKAMISKGDDVQDVKAKLSKLVRDVDKCIAMLKN